MTKQDLASMIAQLVAIEVAKITAAQPVKAAKPVASGKSERSLKNEQLAKTAFKKLGIKNAVPHENVFTFNRWVEKGFRPKEGEKAVKVKNLRLFHITQVRKLTDDDKKAFEQKASNVAQFKQPAAQTEASPQ